MSCLVPRRFWYAFHRAVDPLRTRAADGGGAASARVEWLYVEETQKHCENGCAHSVAILLRICTGRPESMPRLLFDTSPLSTSTVTKISKHIVACTRATGEEGTPRGHDTGNFSFGSPPPPRRRSPRLPARFLPRSSRPANRPLAMSVVRYVRNVRPPDFFVSSLLLAPVR